MKISLSKFSIPRIKLGEKFVFTIITITQQPQNASAFAGQTATFSCLAVTNNSETLNYQWQSSTDGISYNNILNATNSSYTLTAQLPLNNTFYRCIITAKNAATVTTLARTLTVTLAPGKMTIYKLQ